MLSLRIRPLARALQTSQAARSGHGPLVPRSSASPGAFGFGAFRGPQRSAVHAAQPGAGATASAEGSAARPVRAAPMAAMVTSAMPSA